MIINKQLLSVASEGKLLDQLGDGELLDSDIYSIPANRI
jgi:hypothetical protein